MVTVLEYKEQILARFRCGGPLGHFTLCEMSPRHRAVWDRLNRIGARGFHEPMPPDIDGAVTMTLEEIAEIDHAIERC